MDVSRRAIDLKPAPADRRRLEDLVRSGNTPRITPTSASWLNAVEGFFAN